MERDRIERQSNGQAFNDKMDSWNYDIEHANSVGQLQDLYGVSFPYPHFEATGDRKNAFHP